MPISVKNVFFFLNNNKKKSPTTNHRKNISRKIRKKKSCHQLWPFTLNASTYKNWLCDSDREDEEKGEAAAKFWGERGGKGVGF